jgi:hypothetical protein
MCSPATVVPGRSAARPPQRYMAYAHPCTVRVERRDVAAFDTLSNGNHGCSNSRRSQRCICHTERRSPGCPVHPIPPRPCSPPSINDVSLTDTDCRKAPPSNDRPSLHWPSPRRLGKSTQTHLVRHKENILRKGTDFQCSARNPDPSTAHRHRGHSPHRHRNLCDFHFWAAFLSVCINVPFPSLPCFSRLCFVLYER